MNARDVAFLTVRDVVGESKRGAQTAFDYRCSKAQLDDRDRAFAAELAYGSIKTRRFTDWYLKPYIGERLKDLPPSIVEILRLGVYQLRMMGGVEAHAAVHETVNLAMRYGHRGTAGLVNAVLRRFDREQPPAPAEADFKDRCDYLGTIYSLPTWIVREYAERFPEEQLEAIAAGVSQRPQLAVTIDTHRTSQEEVLTELLVRNLSATASPFVAETLILEGAGAHLKLPDDLHYFVQSESAAMAVDILDPKSGESILEFCAGRGNKTLQIAMRQGSTVNLQSIELDERKIAELAERLQKASIKGVRLLVGDARFAEGETVDAVLVDAPCSAIGVIGRHPEARWRKDRGDATRLAATQVEVLRAAVARVKPGGRIVYSVCSTDRREGEGVIAAVQSDTPSLQYATLPERYEQFQIAAGIAVIPPGIDGRDGFFIANLTVANP